MDKMSPIVTLLESFPETIVILILGFTLMGMPIKVNIKKIILIASGQAFLSFFVRSLDFPFGIHTFLQMLLLIFLIKIALNINIRLAALTVLVGLLFLIMSESLLMTIIIFFNINLQEIMDNPLKRSIIAWPHLIILTIFAYWAKRKKFYLGNIINLEAENGNPSKNNSYLDITFMIVVLLQAVILMFLNSSINMNFIGTFETFDISLIVLLNSIFLYITPVLALVTTNKIFKTIERNTILNTQKALLENVNDLFCQLKAQRHDFHNHLQALYGYLLGNDVEGSRNYLASIIKENVQLDNFLKVINPGLCAFLTTKAATAESKNIGMDFQVETNLEDLAVESHHLNRMLGNLIDNAFESVEDLPVEERKVKLRMHSQPGYYIFEINNSGNPITSEVIKKIFEPGFTTKSNHSGIGLFSVKMLLDKYSGDIGVRSNEQEGTVFTLVLPRKEAIIR